MDLSFEIDNVKIEKENAMRRYRQLRKIANMFRFFEICLVLMFLSYFSSLLPTALKISYQYFKNLSVFVASPRFVFLVGNAIILTLFAKSGQQNSTSTSSGTDLYDEYIKNSAVTSQKISTDVSVSVLVLKTGEDEVVFHDKQTVYEEENPVVLVPDSGSVMDGDVKIYQRSRSENSSQATNKKKDTRRELRRSETEICRKVGNKKLENKKREGSEEEEMSNDEFRRKIEDFIAKQKGFLRQESMAIVLQN